MTHLFNLGLDHQFSDQYDFRAQDSIAVGQEPDLLRAGAGNSQASFTRVPGNNLRNYADLALDGQFTRELGFEVGYNNTLYHYAADNPNGANGTWVSPSYAGILDRIEHTIHLDVRYTLQPNTVGLVGYQFSQVDFTAGQIIIPAGPSPLPPIPMYSDSRDNRGHYGYVGVDSTLRSDLKGSLRVGARYTDYFNETGSGNNNVVPFVMLSLNWTYGDDTAVAFIFTHDRGAIDVVSAPASPNSVASTAVLDIESSAESLSLKQRLGPNLYGSLVGQFQQAVYNNPGGLLDGKTDDYYGIGVNVEYQFNKYFSAHAGYNYDRLDSDVDQVYYKRSYDRNRVYLGFTGTF
jgi:hypothetical protein